MNKLIFFTNILDPTAKLGYIQFSLKIMYGVNKGEALFESIQNELKLLFDWYKCCYDSSSTNVVASEVALSQSEVGKSLFSSNSIVKKSASLLKSKYKQHRQDMSNALTKLTELNFKN